MQADFYDVGLRNRLNSSHDIHTNNSGGESRIDNIVLNHDFSKWEDSIRYNLDPKNQVNQEDYTSESDLALLKEARKHINAHNKPVIAENAIVLTHPLYLHLCNMELIETNSVKKEARKYLDKMMELLEMKLPREKVGIVVLESLHNYAAATSVLVEAGMIDHVILTGAHSGYPVDENGLTTDKYGRPIEKDLDVLSGRRIFVGGGYNHKCLMTSNQYVGKKARGYNFWAIHDLIINQPNKKSDTIHPLAFCIDSGRVDFFPLHRVITLEKALGMMGCEGYSDKIKTSQTIH